MALASELVRRVKALRRLSQQVRAEDVTHVMDEDLWVIYIMLVENGRVVCFTLESS